MKDDNYLLKMAAKAAGAEKAGSNGCNPVYAMPVENGNETEYVKWNPLKDDGDALRLAVKLMITVGPEDTDVLGKSLCRVSWDNKCMTLGEYGGGNAMAATRRAIVRSAAKIGESMQ